MPIPPNRDAAVDVDGLNFAYGRYQAVKDVSLKALRGEVFALLGTNGAGKTTSLELIQGYRRPDAGHIRVLGLDPFRQRRSLRRRTGFMLQEAGFLTEMTVRETIELWDSISGRRDSVDRVMDRVDLAGRADVRLDQLSGGEKRRLDIALAVWGGPELVVLDEPTTGLDPESRRRLWSLVDDLRAAGTTIILTTHYLEEAEALADRLAIMHEGRVAVSGTLREVLEAHPATISARLPSSLADDLPALSGSTTVAAPGGADDSDTRALRVETSALQADLTVLLEWADRRGVPLSGLHAQPATLESLFHTIRTRSERLTAEAMEAADQGAQDTQGAHGTDGDGARSGDGGGDGSEDGGDGRQGAGHGAENDVEGVSAR
ncbi:ABC transporter ATP-binding protein [Nocardiopsis sp. RSe5-2]|uniref:ABC transporter ATP-binding protein n=1 Tax=Nocardiopsis endophytica TaxID=3018445 RepID=A0ABT4U749_9ACTN|nr:ABC transporter ATP-binding protein [Nocardiopsis endophytica]MDA2812541.1 ABC transporter ATP-binding protein [Nocardiopsis endophytica]